MNEREIKEMREILERQYKEVSTSKAAARKLLTRLGFLTPSGKLKKQFRPKANVFR